MRRAPGRRGPEGRLQDATIEALKRAGFWCWAVTSGTYVRSGRTYAAAPAGTPDIRIEPFGWLEGKVPKTPKLREAQRLWHEKARRFGTRVAKYTSVPEALNIANAWRNER